MTILNNSGPNTEPWGISRQISDHLLYEEPTLVICFLKRRYSNTKLKLPISNPYASSFVINKSCDKQSHALHQSIKIAPT